MMLTGGIVLISYLQLSTTTRDLQLSRLLSVLRGKLSTYKFHCRRRKSKGLSHTLYGSNLILMFSQGIHSKEMETTSMIKNQEHAPLAETRSESIAHADWLNDHQSAEKQYEYVKLQNFKDTEDPELLWRYGRACHCVYTYSDTAKEAKAAAIWDGLSAVEKAVHIDSQNANAFVILGRLTGCCAELCAYKSMIRSYKMAMQCRDHLKLATELDPSNPDAWFSLGVWNYNLLIRPFCEKIVFYQLSEFKPDLNESIAMMEKSYKLLPRPLTSLYIGKCYLYINKNDEAVKWLEEAANFKSSQALAEGTARAYSKKAALQLLRKL